MARTDIDSYALRPDRGERALITHRRRGEIMFHAADCRHGTGIGPDALDVPMFVADGAFLEAQRIYAATGERRDVWFCDHRGIIEPIRDEQDAAVEAALERRQEGAR